MIDHRANDSPYVAKFSPEFVAFGVIIDDIIFPDGKSSMGVLGGGGLQTAFGMRLWSPSVGLTAGIGLDDQDVIISWLRENQIDTGGLRIGDLPTPRAWQLMEEDGRRTQIWRVPGNVVGNQLNRSMDMLPLNYQQARAYHFGIHPDYYHHSSDPEFIQELRSYGAIVSVEPFRAADRTPRRDELHTLLSSADIFSANQLEAQSLVGVGDPFELVWRLADACGGQGATRVKSSAQIIVVRLGAEGSLALNVATGECIRIPAYPTHVVDPVGAGNAYCGGFLAGWLYNTDLMLAGIWGAVSASFLVEQIGIPKLSPEVLDESRRRELYLRSLTPR